MKFSPRLLVVALTGCLVGVVRTRDRSLLRLPLQPLFRSVHLQARSAAKSS
jgi:hypothetical protein